MTSYFKGQLAKGGVHKAERQLGSKPHFLWTYLEAELEDRVKAAIVSDEFSVMQIFNHQVWTFSAQLAQSDEQKHKLVIREPKLEVLALDPFGPPSSLADGFCWTVLRILQLPQWKGTASAQMLSKSLLQVGPEREEQL